MFSEQGARLDRIRLLITDLKEATEMNQTELEARLNALDAHLGKAADEIQAEVQTLKDELAKSGNTTPGVDASLARLEAKAQALDDRNPDAPEVPADPEVPTTGEDTGGAVAVDPTNPTDSAVV